MNKCASRSRWSWEAPSLLTFEGPFSYKHPPIIKATIKAPYAEHAPRKSVRAMLDTGSNVCVISSAILTNTPLSLLGPTTLITSAGSKNTISYGAALVLEDDNETAVIQPAIIVYGEPVGPYELIIGRAVLDLGTLTAGSGRFLFQISSGHHEPTHYP